MRPLLALLLCGAAGAADIAIGRWHGMLVVTAPTGDGLERLGGRLQQRVSLDLRGHTLTETADLLRQLTGLNIILAPDLVAQPPVLTLQVAGMTLDSALRWIARSAEVHIGLMDGAMYVARTPIAGTATTRLYDVSDLSLPLRHFPGPELAIPAASGGGSRVLVPPGEGTNPGRYDLDALIDVLNRQYSNTK